MLARISGQNRRAVETVLSNLLWRHLPQVKRRPRAFDMDHPATRSVWLRQPDRRLWRERGKELRSRFPALLGIEWSPAAGLPEQVSLRDPAVDYISQLSCRG